MHEQRTLSCSLFPSLDLQKALRTFLENKFDNILFVRSCRWSLSESKIFSVCSTKTLSSADMVSVFWKFPAPQSPKLNPPHSSPLHQEVTSFFSKPGNLLLPSKKQWKATPTLKTNVSGLQRHVNTSDPKLQITHFKDLFQVVQESFVLCTFMERKQKRKFTSRVCPKSFRILALSQASLLFIYFSCNVTNRKNHGYFGNISTHNFQGSCH